MMACDPKLQRLLDKQPGYRQAVRNLKSDCSSTGNPAANIPVEIEQSMKKACAAERDRPFTEIAEEHQTVRQPDTGSGKFQNDR